MSIDIEKERDVFSEAEAAVKAWLKEMSPSTETTARERIAFREGFCRAVEALAATQPAPIPAQELTQQQVADRINGRGVMSPVEFRKFLNGDGVEMYPHQFVALANLFATPPAGNSLTEEAKDANVQWWLAELDQYGNAKLVDGAHDERSGADKAAFLFDQLGLTNDRKLAVAKVEVSAPQPSNDGVNMDAVGACNAMRLSNETAAIASHIKAGQAGKEE